TEALKALGRRLKSWRAGAALLGDPEETRLPWHERGRRLCAQGDAASSSDPQTARAMYLRAMAVWPDGYDAWDGLAGISQAAGDSDTVLVCKRSALQAFERSTAPSPNTLGPYAERLHEMGELLRARRDEDGAATYAEQAYDVRPTFAPAALATA